MAEHVNSHVRTSYSTVSALRFINTTLLVLNVLGTAVVTVVTLGVALIPGAVITLLTWVSLKWMEHTLTLLGDLVYAADATAESLNHRPPVSRPVS